MKAEFRREICNRHLVMVWVCPCKPCLPRMTVSLKFFSYITIQGKDFFLKNSFNESLFAEASYKSYRIFFCFFPLVFIYRLKKVLSMRIPRPPHTQDLFES